MNHPTLLTRRDSLKKLALAGLAGAALPSARAASGSAKPSPAPLGAGYYRKKVGDIELYIVTDGALALESDKFGGQAAEPAEVQEALAATYQPTDMVPGHIHCFVVKTGDRAILVDTGTGGAWGPENGHLTRNLAHAGFAPGAITDVVLTHFHPDHLFGCADADGKPRFPNATHHASEQEWAQWRMPEEAIAKIEDDFLKGMVAEINRQLDAIEDSSKRVAFGQEIAPGVTTIGLPGHTLGHIGLSLESRGQRHWILGDIAHNAYLHFDHPDWHFGFDTDSALAAATRRRTFEQAIAERTEVSASHMPFPGIGHVGRSGEAYRWIPSLWTWS